METITTSGWWLDIMKWGGKIVLFCGAGKGALTSVNASSIFIGTVGVI
jgi:hypothetical protein